MKRQNELHCRVLATNVIEFFGLRLVIGVLPDRPSKAAGAADGRGRGRPPRTGPRGQGFKTRGRLGYVGRTQQSQ